MDTIPKPYTVSWYTVENGRAIPHRRTVYPDGQDPVIPEGVPYLVETGHHGLPQRLQLQGGASIPYFTSISDGSRSMAIKDLP
jgi:hypothetical protein